MKLGRYRVPFDKELYVKALKSGLYMRKPEFYGCLNRITYVWWADVGINVRWWALAFSLEVFAQVWFSNRGGDSRAIGHL